jgi:predicted SnoaL-like aldol condensation-catalyzing enzyme
MAWTYSGDPSSSELDKYRFFVGDTDVEEPILQDGEVQFVIDSYKNHNTRLYHLFDAAAHYFARQIERKVGPIEEKPVERLRYYRTKANYYRQYASTTSLPITATTLKPSIFRVGMNDNARY